jgi:N-acetylmuramoyl-L-alanine amidase
MPTGEKELIKVRSLYLLFGLLPLFINPCTFAAVQIKPSSTNSIEGPGAKAGSVAMSWPGGTFPDTLYEGMQYVSSLFLESLFSSEGAWIPDRQKFVLADSSGKKWYFTLDNPYMNIGNEVFNLGFPVRRGPEYLFLPVTALLRILNQRGYAVEVQETPGKIEPGLPSGRPDKSLAHNTALLPGGPNIFDIGAQERDNGTLVTVRTTGKLEYESFWVPPHFILKLQGGILAPQYPLKAPGQGLVKNILTLQEKDVAQITLTIPKAIDTIEVTYSPQTLAFQVLVHKKSNKPLADRSLDQKNSGKVAGKAFGTIIIDPGHGGKDPGAQVAGVSEANVTLAVAKELKLALTKMGFKALMTREDDRFVELKDRPKFASEQGGDLFVSLHCNSIGGSLQRKKTVKGFTAYILREGESEEDKTLARRENQAVSEESGKNNKSEISPVEWILLEHQLNLYSKESEAFIDKVVKEFEGYSISKYATGASQAGFYVLVGAYMPAVLFEMGFLTHDEDRRILASEKGQKQIAERLAKAILKYQQSLSPKTKAGDAKKLNSK